MLVLALLISAALSLDPSPNALHEFCWKDSYPRGVGTVPNHCPKDQEKIGLLCYPNCPSGMYRWGFDCHSYCPDSPGWDDQGLFCRLCEYGRGGGYPWKFGDGFSDDGMIRRCQADYGRGNCEKNGAMYYPKCDKGYYAFGCCICRPDTPKCSDFNLNPGVDLSCAKKVIIGVPYTGECDSDQEKDVGLCYKKCDSAYDGVGPVCWGKNPDGWVGCGMGSAISSKICAETIFNQIMSVGQMALNVVTLGATAAASKSVSDLEELQKKFDDLTKLYLSTDMISDIADAAVNDPDYAPIAKDADQCRTVDVDKVLPEDLARIAASIAALVDPTGIAGTVASFTYPKCSSILEKFSAEESHQFQLHNTQEEERRYNVELSHKSIEEQYAIMSQAIQEGRSNPDWFENNETKVQTGQL